MSGILQHIASLILIYRYPALFIVSFLSSLGVPVPAAASAVAAAAFASQGYLSISLLIFFGAAGNIIGDLTMYWLMRRYGKRVLYWLHLKRLADSHLLSNVEGTVDTYKAPIIIASRFQDQATTLVNIISGLGRMNLKRFAIFVSIGDFLQIAFYIGLGVVFSDNWQAIYDTLSKFSWIIGLVVAIVVVVISTKGIQKAVKPNVGVRK